VANYNAIRYDITWLQDGERLGPSAQACLVLADDMLKIESGKVTRKMKQGCHVHIRAAQLQSHLAQQLPLTAI
jgi:hypothetical protein